MQYLGDAERGFVKLHNLKSHLNCNFTLKLTYFNTGMYIEFFYNLHSWSYWVFLNLYSMVLLWMQWISGSSHPFMRLFRKTALKSVLFCLHMVPIRQCSTVTPRVPSTWHRPGSWQKRFSVSQQTIFHFKLKWKM